MRPPSSQPAACSTTSVAARIVAHSIICGLGGGLRVDGAGSRRARRRRGTAARSGGRAAAPARTPKTDSGVPNAGEPVRMSVTGEERPVQARRARAHELGEGDARQRLGHLLGEPAGSRSPALVAPAEQERRHDDRLVRLGPRDQARRPSGSPRSAGEFGFTMPMSAGSASIASRPPCTISAI